MNRLGPVPLSVDHSSHLLEGRGEQVGTLEEPIRSLEELLRWAKTSDWAKTLEISFLVWGDEALEYLGPCDKHFALENFYSGDWEFEL